MIRIREIDKQAYLIQKAHHISLFSQEKQALNMVMLMVGKTITFSFIQVKDSKEICSL